MEVLRPYEDKNNIRTFSKDVNEEELIWHRDKQWRYITILEGENWQLQMDNELPKVLEMGQTYLIPRMVYHRVIKGEGDLKILIEKVKIWQSRKQRGSTGSKRRSTN